jgi:tetratricopeptide (TPR) repeat protein
MNLRNLQIMIVGAALLLLAACKPDGPKSLAKGKEQMEKRAYGNAIIEFRNALKAMPKDAEVHYQMGMALLATGDFNGGVQFLRRATEIDPKHAASQTKLAELMATSGNSEVVKDAERRLKLLGSKDAEGADAQTVLALAELRLGKLDEGTKKLEEVLARSPQAIKAAAVLAQMKLSKGDQKGAEDLILKAAQTAPKEWEGWMTLARFYEAQRRLPDAEKMLGKVLQLDPNNEMALSDLGTLQMLGKRPAEAEATFRRLSEHPSKRYRGMHAVYLFQTDRRNEALAEIEELHKTNPADGQLRSQLVTMYLEMNQADKAEKVLADAVKRSPKDLQTLTQHSAMLARMNRIAELETEMTTAIQSAPKNANPQYLAEAHYLMSRAYAGRNAPNQERELREALRLRPDLIAARVELSQIMLASNRAKEAIELLNAEKQPGQKQDSLPVIVQKNWVYFNLGQIDQMKEGLKAGYQQGGRVPDLLFQEALLAVREKRYPQARGLLKEALNQRPFDIRVLGALAESHVAEDRSHVARALAEVEAHTAKYPNNMMLQEFRAGWLVAAGRHEDAKAAYRAVLAAAPDSKSAAYALVRIDLGTGKTDEARKVLDGILTKTPNDPGANMLLAMLFEQTGKQADAVMAYRKVLSIEPNNALALNNLAYRLSLEPGKIDEAAQMAEKANNANPENPAVLDTLGWIHYRKGLYWSSVRHLETATKIPQNATPIRLFHLAMAYEKAGDKGKAAAAYKRGIQVAEGAKLKMPPEADEAKKTLGI